MLILRVTKNDLSCGGEIGNRQDYEKHLIYSILYHQHTHVLGKTTVACQFLASILACPSGIPTCLLA